MKTKKIPSEGELTALTNEDDVLPSNSPSNLPAFLFIPGMCGTADQFEMLVKTMKQRAYALNLRGHGTSVGELRKASFLDYCDDIRDAILAIGQVYLIGHSMGGLIAQVIAQESAMRPFVRKVVLLASTPPAGIKIPFRIGFLRPRYLWAMAFSKPFELHPKEKKLFRHPNDFYPPFERESGKAVGEILLGNLVGAWRVIRTSMPTLVVAGTEDEVFPLSIGTQKEIAKFHGALYREVVTGHMIHCEPKGERFFTEEIVLWCLGNRE